MRSQPLACAWRIKVIRRATTAVLVSVRAIGPSWPAAIVTNLVTNLSLVRFPGQVAAETIARCAARTASLSGTVPNREAARPSRGKYREQIISQTPARAAQAIEHGQLHAYRGEDASHGARLTNPPMQVR